MTMQETHEIRVKRLSIQSKRRGIKELDLLLGRFADNTLIYLDEPALDEYERLLDEADADIFNWIKNESTCPPEHGRAVRGITAVLKLYDNISKAPSVK